MLLELLSEFKSLKENQFTMSNQEKLKKSSSPEVSSSISEFLEQERLCKELCSTIASDVVGASVNSAGVSEFPRCDSALNISDLSDDDIGSILEKMNQIMSPSKSSQDSGSMSNSLYDGKDRNIEDILQEAETLMQESSSFQPPAITNLVVETSGNSRAQSPNPSVSLSYHSMNSDQKIGKDVSNLSQEKTEDFKLDKAYGGSVRGKVCQNEAKDMSATKHVGLSVNSSVRLKTHNQRSDCTNKRKSRSSEPKVKENYGGARQVDLNETFLVENNAHSRSVFHSRSTSKGTLVSHGPKKYFSSQGANNHVENVKSTTKKNLLAQVNSQIDCKEGSEEKCYREYISKSATKADRESVLTNELEESVTKKAEEVYEEIRVEIEQVLRSKAAKLDGLSTPIQTPTLNGSFPNLKLSYPGLETPSVDVPSCFNLEKEFLEERKRCLKLKADLEWIGRVHSDEVVQLQKQHNEEMFALKKEVVLLTAQLSEKILPAPTVNSAKESERHKVEMLEKEMAEQEVLLAGYQRENELLCAELRSVKKLLKKLMSLLRKES